MIKHILITLFTFIGLIHALFADYPIVGYRYIADPGAFVYNGRVYIYCSNDDENVDNDGYQMSSLVCISTSDMKNWTDHGVVVDVPRDASWTTKSWAPSPVYRDGKFYLYYGNGGSAIGVLVADSPLGPFTDPLNGPIVNSSTPGVQPFDGWLFDPMTYVDDDGQAYMYFGGNGDDNLRVIKLNDDMISVDGAATAFDVPNFFEAAWVHKYNGTYYFSYSTTPSAGIRIDYMTSNNPMSGFSYRGVMSPQPPQNNNNNHQAVFEFGGNWYQAYHNRTVATNAGEPTAYKRNMAVDQLFHQQDGTIAQMINTVDGLDQLGYLNPFERVEGETMSEHSGIETEVCSAGGMNLAYIDNGDWTMVEGVDFGPVGANEFTASVASNQAGGVMEIHLGSPTGTLIGAVNIPNTGGYQAWQEVTITTTNVTGVHNVYFTFSGTGNGGLFNVDYWHFSEAAGALKISLVSPTEGEPLFVGEPTTIDVEVSDEDGTIQNVFYYINDELIQQEWVAPYAFQRTFEAPGTYEIRAVATDNDGNQNEDVLTVVVYIPQGPFGETAWPIPGTIQAEDYDVGGQDFAFNETDESNQGNANYRDGDGVDVETTGDSEGTYNVGYILNGEWLEYTVNVAEAGLYDVDLRMAKDGDNGMLHIEMDGNNVTGTIDVPNTGGWQTWETVTVNDVQLEAGEQIMRIAFDSDYMNLNYVSFSPVETDFDNDGTPTSEDCDDSNPQLSFPITWYLDNDDDGLGDPAESMTVCAFPEGYVRNQDDLNDNDYDNDGINTADDCDDNNPDISLAYTWYADTDADGVGVATNEVESCTQPPGYVETFGDECPNDGNKTAPGDCGCGATEESCLDCAGIPNGDAFYDNCDNCVGSPEEACTQDCYGDWGGTAAEDVCGTCAGGNTGIVPVTDPQNCIATGAKEDYLNDLKVYPNPTTGVLHLSVSSSWKIFNTQGEQVLKGQSAEVDLSALSKGIYFLNLENKIVKIVKE